MSGSKSKFYLSLFNSNFWHNGGVHPLSLHKMVTRVSAVDILSLLLSFYCYSLAITKPNKKQILRLCTPQNLARDWFPSRFQLHFSSLPTPSFRFFFSLNHSPKTTYTNPLKHTNIVSIDTQIKTEMSDERVCKCGCQESARLLRRIGFQREQKDSEPWLWICACGFDWWTWWYIWGNSWKLELLKNAIGNGNLF